MAGPSSNPMTETLTLGLELAGAELGIPPSPTRRAFLFRVKRIPDNKG